MSNMIVYDMPKFADVNRAFRKDMGFDMMAGMDIPREVTVRTTRLELARVMDYECCHCGMPTRVLLQPHSRSSTHFDCGGCNAHNIVTLDAADDYLSVFCCSRDVPVEVSS